MRSNKAVRLICCILSLVGFTTVSHAQTVPTGRKAVVEATKALGGLARVNATRNITLYGYGMTSWMWRPCHRSTWTR